MGKYILFYFILLSLIQITIQQTELIPIYGIINITYDRTQNKTTFRIPLKETSDISEINLNLSEPLREDRTNCISTCRVTSNIMYCEIYKSNCELLFNNSVIRIDSIVGTNYIFNDYSLLTSEINFEINQIEMTCSNFQLSFFLYNNDLNKHPFQNMDFTIPIYYRNKSTEAKCILPKNGKYIPCVINATRILFEKDYTIDFDINNPIKINNDLNLTLTKILGYKLEDDCGKEIDGAQRLYKFNSRITLILFSLFFLFKIF